tara:strand:+ start:33 stop:368 length:336 start_codon:yes stop_codon:yes gene_type:complete
MTYKRFVLEYYKGDPLLNPKMGSKTNKDPNNVLQRKHANTVNKEYDHKHPIVDKICRGGANNVPVQGQVLQSVLKAYGMAPEVGSKVLGNSQVSITIKNTPRGLMGTLNKR